tara:strand:+ start:2009 stop:2911 length:903 start_codon:yes stop_codon:yes gene_type:complete
MATNVHFSQKVRAEQDLYEDIVIESLKMFGQDVYYLPRDLVNEDRILGDDVPSRFNSSYKIEMYLQNIEGFEGEGDLFTRFGVQIRDEATFVVARKRWTNTVALYDNDISSIRPREGDLIYLPLSNSMFEIMHVEHEQPFYQLSNLPVYQLRTQLFEYNDEDFDTNIEAIDDIQHDFAYEYSLTINTATVEYTFDKNEQVSQTFSDGVKIFGEVSDWNPTTGILKLTNVGADDGKYHTFITGSTISGSVSRTVGGAVASGSVTAVSEDNQISSNEQNADFDSIESTFLDFSETNPFGDPQ